ncbi:MAG: hypothetical protein Q8P30_01360 [Candidatus Uhrbacteria bacterium]|nr:hypothetical protein [Candidatus Uhrbacteria bacterium]
MEELFYFSVSFITAIMAIVSAYIAWYAVQRGLTHSALLATVWSLSFMGAARLWHAVRELIAFGEWAEFVEYSLYIIAYAMFITLILKARKTPTAQEVRERV